MWSLYDGNFTDQKYGTQSALTDFTEFTMLEPGPLAPYVGFTENEVKKLCTGHHMDYEEMRRWYDGYYFDEIGHVYNPNSVIKAVFAENTVITGHRQKLMNRCEFI